MTPREVLQQVRRIEIATRGLVHEFFAGEYQSVFKGRGMDFAEVRAYQYGDDFRSIDWNVTARAGDPFVKVFREERALTVIFAVDVSASADFGTRGRMKRELAAEICALLAFSAVHNNDRVGLVLFSDRIEKFVPPRTGRRNALRILRELLYCEPAGRGTRIEAALEHLNRVNRRRALVFLVSDFVDEGFWKLLDVTSRRHDVIAVRVADAAETQLPPIGFVEFRDAESGELVTVNTSRPRFREAFRRGASRTRRELEADLRKAGVDVVEVQTDASYVEPLRHFFKTRAQRFR